jgi:serine/threonine protein kinase
MKFLGRGKFSDVYLARDIRSDFLVALKIIKKEVIWSNKMEK